MTNKLKNISSPPELNFGKMKQILLVMLYLLIFSNSSISASNKNKYIISYYKWLKVNKENVADDFFVTQDKKFEWEINAHSAVHDQISEDRKFYFAFQQDSNILLIINLEDSTEKRYHIDDCSSYCGMNFVYDQDAQKLLLQYTDIEQIRNSYSLSIIDLKTGKLGKLDKKLFTNMIHMPNFNSGKIIYEYEIEGSTDIKIVDTSSNDIQVYRSPSKYVADTTITDDNKLIIIGVNAYQDTPIIIQDLNDLTKKPIEFKNTFPVDHIQRELAPGVFLLEGYNYLIILNTITNSTYTLNNPDKQGWSINENPIIKYDPATGKVLYGYIKNGGVERIRFELNNYDINNNSNEQKVIKFDYDPIKENRIHPALLVPFDITFDGHLIYIRDGQGYILEFDFNSDTTKEIPNDDVTNYFKLQKELSEQDFWVHQRDINLPEG
jgi:hypothetical protein